MSETYLTSDGKCVPQRCLITTKPIFAIIIDRDVVMHHKIDGPTTKVRRDRIGVSPPNRPLTRTMELTWHALPALGADGALLSNSKRVDPHGRFPGRPWALTRLFPGAAMVGDDRDIRNRVAHVVAQLRQISEGSGRINARDGQFPEFGPRRFPGLR